MVAEGAMENPKPAAVLGLHCSTTGSPIQTKDDDHEAYLNAGQLGYTIGPASANSDRFMVVIHGKMAHGASPSRGVDAIAIAAEAIVGLQMIRSRETSTSQPLVITVGTIQGGQRENILAERVEFGGTVRTYDVAFRDKVIQLMERTLKGITEAHGATYELEYRKGYPSIDNNEELVQRLLPTLRRIAGPKNVFEQKAGMGGEDFSYFAQLVPGFYYRLGVANEKEGIIGGTHTPMFDADERSIITGVECMAAMVCDYLDSAASGGK
jgi:amidohydrolase